MKTFKQFLIVTLFAVFMLATSNVNTQKIEHLIEIQKNNNPNFFSKTDLNVSTIVVDKLSVITSESRYFEKISATITITFNQENRKITSISIANNTLSDSIIADIINKSNTATASNCHCIWYDVWCRGMCALCEAGVIDCDFQ